MNKPLRVYAVHMTYRMDGIADVAATSAAEAERLFVEAAGTADAYEIFWEQGDQLGRERAKLMRYRDGSPVKP